MSPRFRERTGLAARLVGGAGLCLSVNPLPQPFASALASRSTPSRTSHSRTPTRLDLDSYLQRSPAPTRRPNLASPRSSTHVLLHARAPPSRPRASSTQRHRLSRSIAPHHLPKASAPPWPTRTVSSGKRSRVPAVSSGTAPPSCARTHATRCSRSQTFAHKPERHPAPP